MRKTLLLAGVLLAFGAAQATAQALHYDPYYVLPGAAGGIGIDAGLSTVDASSIGEMSDLYAMGKYSITDKLEVGARATFGFLFENKDPLSTVIIGAKYGLTESSALSLNLLTPLFDAEDPGLSVGYMQTLRMSGIDVNNHLQVGLLDGYAPQGIGIELKIEPKKTIDEQMTAFLDILIKTNTDSIGDNLAIDLWPNLDYVVQEGLVVNAGITVGVAGDRKQDDIGVVVAAIKTMSK